MPSSAGDVEAKALKNQALREKIGVMLRLLLCERRELEELGEKTATVKRKTVGEQLHPRQQQGKMR